MPFASVHRHLTDGTDPGADWMSADFDDSSWGEGRAPFGYGYADELTPLTAPIADPDEAVISHYFRSTVEVSGNVTEAILRLEYDDGMVLFVNGQEAVRANLDSLEHGVQAPGPVDEPAREYELLDPNLFQQGTNTLAVLVQQHVPDPVPDTGGAVVDPIDVRFDMSLELTEVQVQPTERCPPLQVHVPMPEGALAEGADKDGCACGAATAGGTLGVLLLGGLAGALARRRRESD